MGTTGNFFFLMQKEPEAKINQCLSHFGGMFTKNSLQDLYHEASFIIEQDFKVIEKSIC
jgi:hypothetical protein